VPSVATRVLVDAENVRRSVWPNLTKRDLCERAATWAKRTGMNAVVVFDGPAPACSGEIEVVGTTGESADDWLAREAGAYGERGESFWLVTSDRELRTRAGSGAEKVVGGGSFARELQAVRPAGPSGA
jgi:predicted RNA-binding protein with PIN domain